jgi:hypothetical protein
MDLEETRWAHMGWINLTPDMDHWPAVVNTGSIKYEEL